MLVKIVRSISANRNTKISFYLWQFEFVFMQIAKSNNDNQKKKNVK